LPANKLGPRVIAKVNIDDDRLDALKALLQVFKAMSDVAARIAVNSVKCRRILHINEMSFVPLFANSLLTECKAFKTTPSKGSLHLGEELFCLSHDK
jgi:hypothetical protein